MSDIRIDSHMATVDFENVKGLEVIGQDACILGEVLDIRYEDLTWGIQGFKVKSEKSVSKKINVGSGKSMLLVQPGKYVIGDVVLMPDYARKDAAGGRHHSCSCPIKQILDRFGRNGPEQKTAFFHAPAEEA